MAELAICFTWMPELSDSVPHLNGWADYAPPLTGWVNDWVPHQGDWFSDWSLTWTAELTECCTTCATSFRLRKFWALTEPNLLSRSPSWRPCGGDEDRNQFLSVRSYCSPWWLHTHTLLLPGVAFAYVSTDRKTVLHDSVEHYSSSGWHFSVLYVLFNSWSEPWTCGREVSLSHRGSHCINLCFLYCLNWRTPVLPNSNLA